MSELLKLTLALVWFLLPAGVANLVPVVAAKLNWLPAFNHPLDFFKTFRGRRIFGAHKTWRGLMIGIIFGSVTAIIQHTITPFASVGHAAFIGALLGFGALAGDAAKSFIKRQLHIAPGHGWHPFDQIDYVIGALLITWRLVHPTIFQALLVIALFGVSSYAVSFIGVKLKIKKSL